MSYFKIKNVVAFFLLAAIIFSGCSENPSESDQEPVDETSGVYFIHGKQIDLTYDFPWPSWGGDVVILSRDTVETSFTIQIEIEEDRVDTLKFIGLPRASSSYRHLECHNVTPNCAFVKKIGPDLKFNLLGPSDNQYRGSGTLENGELTLNTHFEYRGIGIDYLLQGEKVEP